MQGAVTPKNENRIGIGARCRKPGLPSYFRPFLKGLKVAKGGAQAENRCCPHRRIESHERRKGIARTTEDTGKLESNIDQLHKLGSLGSLLRAYCNLFHVAAYADQQLDRKRNGKHQIRSNFAVNADRLLLDFAGSVTNRFREAAAGK